MRLLSFVHCALRRYKMSQICVVDTNICVASCYNFGIVTKEKIFVIVFLQFSSNQVISFHKLSKIYFIIVDNGCLNF